MIWVIGASGMLGRQLSAELDLAKIPHVGTDLEVDITDPAEVSGFAGNNKISKIVNCAAYTAVDKAESEPEKAFAVNAAGAGNIAAAAAELDAALIHISTDYVYDGTLGVPYREDDAANPLNVYGGSKLEGERLISEQTSKAYIIRISWLYGVHGGNFVKTMIRLFSERGRVEVVDDQFGSPTYAGALAENIVRLLRGAPRPYGLYLYSDDGYLSWCGFARAVREMAMEFGYPFENVSIDAVSTGQYPTAATRPRDTRFDKSKVARLGFGVVKWKDNLRRYFEELKRGAT